MKEISRDKLRLSHMLQSIITITQYVNSIGYSSFADNEMMQSACVGHLEIIGEACSKISNELKIANPKVPWREITGLRNMVVHEYPRVDVAEIWTTIQQDLPVLKEQIKMIRDSLP